MAKIKNIKARQVFDSRGNPTVEAEIILDNDIRASAIVPSGASTGTHEAHELRDNKDYYFKGKSVLDAVRNINIIIFEEIKHKDECHQVKRIYFYFRNFEMKKCI